MTSAAQMAKPVTRYATAESRSKGGLARAAKIREEKLTVRGRLARIAEEEAHSIAGVFIDAMRAEAFGRPVQALRDDTPQEAVVYSSSVLDVLEENAPRYRSQGESSSG